MTEPLRFLLIEDDLLDVELVQRSLLRMDLTAEVVVVAEGTTGLDYCRQQHFDAVLLDYRLPDLNGLELLRALTGGDTSCPLPVVVLTGQGDETVAVEFMKHGAQDYLVKEQLTPELLERALVNAIEKTALVRQVRQQQAALARSHADLETANRRLCQEVDERKQVEERLRAFLEAAPDATVIVDHNGTIEFINAQTEALFGYARSELLGKPIERLLPTRFAERHAYLRQAFFAAPRPRRMGAGRELVGQTKDGRELPLEISLNAIPANGGRRVAASVRDISERKHAERALNAEKERAQVTLASIGDAVITTDAHGCIDYLNPVAEALTGWALAEAAGQPLADVFCLVTEHHRDPAGDPVSQCLTENRVIERGRNTLLRSRNGDERYIQVTAAPIRDENGVVLGAVLVFNDTTKARRLEQEILHQATHDALTGLVNRREFERRLQRILDAATAQGGEHALCYLDLDQFKVVNDTCGHAAGDELLRQIAALFQTQVRSRDTLARLGGDEFAVLLEHCSARQAERVANDLRQAVDAFRFGWNDKSFTLGVSIGLVPIDARAQSVNAVLRAADSACYVAKDAGRNRVHVYHDDDQALARRHGEMQWVEKITRALEADRFQLTVQPIVPISPRPGQLSHQEVLLRLVDERGQVVLPGAFLPAAERYHLATRIDRWVVANTLRWLADAPVGRHELFAVNLSGQSLGDKAFLADVIRQLKHTGVDAARVCFEITETAAIANLASAIRFMDALKQHGCRFALDDFGSGLSSFGYLKNLPVDFVKIDGAFVKDVVHDSIDLAMVRAINEIGQLMGKQTIAEFVENDEILAKLRQVGVDYAQGYGIGRPQPLDGQPPTGVGPTAAVLSSGR